MAWQSAHGEAPFNIGECLCIVDGVRQTVIYRRLAGVWQWFNSGEEVWVTCAAKWAPSRYWLLPPTDADARIFAAMEPAPALSVAAVGDDVSARDLEIAVSWLNDFSQDHQGTVSDDDTRAAMRRAKKWIERQIALRSISGNAAEREAQDEDLINALKAVLENIRLTFDRTEEPFFDVADCGAIEDAIGFIQQHSPEREGLHAWIERVQKYAVEDLGDGNSFGELCIGVGEVLNRFSIVPAGGNGGAEQ